MQRRVTVPLALALLAACEAPCAAPDGGVFDRVTYDARVECTDIAGPGTSPGVVAIGYDVRSVGFDLVESGTLAITVDWSPAGSAPSVTEHRDFLIDTRTGRASSASIRLRAPDGVAPGPHAVTCRITSVAPTDEQPCNDTVELEALVDVD